jgi:hypothetical protein
MADARPAMDWMLGYLERLWEEIPLWDAMRLPPFLPRARRIATLMRDLHRLNILATHQWLQRQEAPVAAAEGS